MSLFEPKPRWPGAPPVCVAENRMAFKDQAALHAYRASIGMSAYPPAEVWRCGTCSHLHYVGVAPSPSGESSGTSRSAKSPKLPKPQLVGALRRLRESVQ